MLAVVSREGVGSHVVVFQVSLDLIRSLRVNQNFLGLEKSLLKKDAVP